MSLKDTINNGVKEAMKAKDQDRLRTLRAVKAAILLAETETGAKAELSADGEMKILMKLAKQRKDSASMYKEQNRDDLYQTEAAELAILEEFLPKQLSDEELTAKLKEIISTVGAAGPQDMGKVMGASTKQLAGLADGKAISAKVKELLS